MLVWLALAALDNPLSAAESCSDCHPVALAAPHAELACQACHAPDQATAHAQGGPGAAEACVGCHAEMAGIFQHDMATRAPERAFVAASFGQHDAQFFNQNCQGCHVSSCRDCHGSGHQVRRPDTATCLACHKGGAVGWDYLGRAPREDSLRYQRGPKAQGEHYLTMRPDVHAEAGLSCADCHSKRSLLTGRKSSHSCVDCHQPDPKIIEHSIAQHLEKLECYACHSAWSPQEYGSFYLQMIDSPARDYFYVRQNPRSDTIKSAYLKLQQEPPLGWNQRGRLSPMRPFIGYFSRIVAGEPEGEENRLVTASWQAFFPHTIRRGTAMCEGCHANPRRFLHEPPQERVYRPDLDGLKLESFWNQTGQQLRNGRFLNQDELAALESKSPAYIKAYIQKWQSFIQHVAP